MLIHENDMWVGADGYLAHLIAYKDHYTDVEVQRRVPQDKGHFHVGGVKDLVWGGKNILVCAGTSIFGNDTALHWDGLLHSISSLHKRYYCVYMDKKE